MIRTGVFCFLAINAATLISAGEPYFTAGDEISLGSGASTPRHMKSADFNGDGDLDIVLVADFQDDIFVYENDDTFPPSFTRSLVAGLSIPVTDIEVADFNRDGLPDISAVSDGSTSGQLYYNQSSESTLNFTLRTFTSNQFVPEVTDHAIGDINGDGLPDIVGVNTRDDRIAWMENPGGISSSWTFHLIDDDPDSPTSGSNGSVDGPTCVAVGDVDNDGDNDIVVGAGLTNNGIYYFENDGAASPAFTFRTVDTDHSVDYIDLVDYNNDGDLDFGTLDFSALQARIYVNDGTPGSGSATTRSYLSSIDAATFGGFHSHDFNTDGFPDILLVGANTSDPFVYLENIGSRLSMSFTSVDLNSDPVFKNEIATDLGASVVFDVDGDCDLDLFAGEGTFSGAGSDPSAMIRYTNFSYHRNLRYETPAPNIFTSLSSASRIETGDMNNDGLDDFVFIEEGEDAIKVGLNSTATPGSFSEIDTFNNGTGIKDISIDDIDGNGDLDIAFVADGGNGLQGWLENSGGSTPAFSDRTYQSGSFFGSKQIETGDLDNDGDIDVIYCGHYDSVGSEISYLLWEENNGEANPTFSQRIIELSGVYGAESLELADLDRDGDLDAVLSHVVDTDIANLSTITWYENDGAASPSFSPNAVPTLPSNILNAGRDVAVGDMDGDGDLDVVATNLVGDTITWYASDGASDPSFELRTTDVTVVDPEGLKLGDLDCDGDLDILTTNGPSDYGVLLVNNGLSSPGFERQNLPNFVSNAVDLAFGDFHLHGRNDIVALGNSSAKMFKEEGGDYEMVVLSVEPDYWSPSYHAAAALIQVEHKGRFEHDPDLDLLNYTYQFTDPLLNPLDMDEVRDLYVSVSLYRDDGDMQFDENSDTLLHTTSSLPDLPFPTVTYSLPDTLETQVSPGQTGYFFITAEVAEGAYLPFQDSQRIQVVDIDFEIGQYESFPVNGRSNATMYSGTYSFFFNVFDSTDSDGNGFSDAADAYYAETDNGGFATPPLGDYNGDNSSDTLDAIELYRDDVAGFVPNDEFYDLNYDFSSTIDDAIILYNWAIGKEGYEVIPRP